MHRIDKKIIDRNLLLTQTYCEMQLAITSKSAAEILRSFNPEYNGQPVFSFGSASYEGHQWSQVTWNVDPLSSQFDPYKELFEKQLCYKQENIEGKRNEQFYKGRILAAEVDKTVIDGASESESDGLIDIYDCPPIDTWFYLINDEHGMVLLAWIPEKFVELIDNAININCIDCLSWYGGDDYLVERNREYLQAHHYRKVKHSWVSILVDKLKSSFK